MDGLLLCRKVDEAQGLQTQTEITVTPARWYVLIVSSIVACTYNFVFQAYSPLAISLRYLLGWHEGIYGRFILYQTVSILLLFLPWLWLINKFGIKTYVLIMAITNFVASFMRCFPKTSDDITLIANISQVLLSIMSVGCNFLTTFITASWFPLNEWHIATSISYSIIHFGNILPFITGPAVVPRPDKAHYDKSLIFTGYQKWTYITAAVSTFIMIVVVLYLPRKPRNSPSHTSNVPRAMSVLKGSKKLHTSKYFWIMAIRFSFSCSNLALIAITVLYLKSKGLNQFRSGEIVFYAGLSQIILQPILGKIADKIDSKGVKATLVACSSLFLIATTWLWLMNPTVGGFKVTETTTGFAAVLLITSAAGTGLSYESASQFFYPLAESTTACWLTVIQCVFAALFGAILLIKDVGLIWIDWYNVITAFIGLICAACLPTNGRRKLEEMRSSTETGTDNVEA